jgi:hypothetical protein
MRSQVVLLAAIAVSGCTAVPSTTPSNASTPTPAVAAFASPTVTAALATAVTAAPSPWRVDVINGPRPVVIRMDLACLTPPTSADCWAEDAWRIEPNARLTLVDQEGIAHFGSFDLLQASGDLPSLGHCYVFQTLHFLPESFTIVLTGDRSGPRYAAKVEYEPTVGPDQPELLPRAPQPSLSDPQFANCSG